MAVLGDPIHLGQVFYDVNARRARRVADFVQAWWKTADNTDLSVWFDETKHAPAARMVAAQHKGVNAVNQYMLQQTIAQNVEPPAGLAIPDAYAASPETATAALYAAGVITAKRAIARGAPLQEAIQGVALRSLLSMVSTFLYDPVREAADSLMAASPMRGYIRMVNLPTCSRCAILAGKFFKWNDGFQRHPNCECVHIPMADVPEDYAFDFKAAMREGKILGLSAEEKEAINMGADINQVVNARRGMRVEQVFGRNIEVTSEGTTVRGLFGGYEHSPAGDMRARGGSEFVRRGGRYAEVREPRLTPRECIRQAGGDKVQAADLLVYNGYITDGVPDAELRAAVEARRAYMGAVRAA
ncbi:MAG: hypothetical protein WAN89_02785 [Lawsonella sp.]